MRVLSCLETLIGHVMFLKGLIADAFESSELLHLLRLNGLVGAIPTYRESTDSLILCRWIKYILQAEELQFMYANILGVSK